MNYVSAVISSARLLMLYLYVLEVLINDFAHPFLFIIFVSEYECTKSVSRPLYFCTLKLLGKITFE